MKHYTIVDHTMSEMPLTKFTVSQYMFWVVVYFGEVFNQKDTYQYSHGIERKVLPMPFYWFGFLYSWEITPSTAYNLLTFSIQNAVISYGLP